LWYNLHIIWFGEGGQVVIHAFSLFLFFFILYYLRFVFVGKILLHELTMSSKEIIYISLTGFTLIIFRVVAMVVRDMLNLPQTDVIFTVYLFAMPLFFLYLFSIKNVPVKRSLLLTVLATMLSTAAVDILLYYLDIIKIPQYGSLVFTNTDFWIPIVLAFALSGVVAFLSQLGLRKFWVYFDTNLTMQNAFLLIAVSFTVLVGFMRLHTSAINYRDSIDALAAINLLMVLPFIVAVFVHSKSTKDSFNKMREKEERRNMQNHLRELEQQFTSIRKFKHDYQNILSSMETYISEDNLPGLKQYFFNNVKPTFETVTTGNFVFEALSKIDIPEIKSLLSAKIVMAQNISVDVETSFEAPDQINDVYIDSITLIRMLGIILDNAIEELDALRAGKLAIACFKDKESVVFIVQNTCRNEIPTLQAIKESGFTTKDNHSGLGLHILEELQGTCPNISLTTTIDTDTFTQKLTISKAENESFEFSIN